MLMMAVVEKKYYSIQKGLLSIREQPFLYAGLFLCAANSSF